MSQILKTAAKKRQKCRFLPKIIFQIYNILKTLSLLKSKEILQKISICGIENITEKRKNHYEASENDVEQQNTDIIL